MGRVKIIVILGILLFPWCTYGSARPNHSLAGVWMDTLYIKALQTSSSPRIASYSTGIPVLHIDDEGKTLRVSYGFHEEERYVIRSVDRFTGKIALKKPNGRLRSLRFTGNSILVRYEGFDKGFVSARFVKIAPPSDSTENAVYPYVARTVLAGSYKTGDGHSLIFGPDNTMTWDGETCEYIIWIDFVLFAPMDVFSLRKKGSRERRKTFGFATDGVVLQVYEYDRETNRIGKLLLELLKE